jgi:hypothetical protein
MISGVPGTSISGLYYVLLALFMPVKEVWRTFQGESSWKRWKHVSWIVFLAMGLVTTVVMTGYALAYFLKPYVTVANQSAVDSFQYSSIYGATIALIILAFVLY